MSEPEGPSQEHAERHPRSWMQVAVATAVSAGVGLALGAAVQRTTAWVDDASTAPDQYGQLGRGLIALVAGAPLVLAVSLAACGLLRVRLWAVAGLAGPWLAVELTSIAHATSTSPLRADNPVVVPWCWALGLGAATFACQLLSRPVLLAAVLVPTAVGLVVLSGRGADTQRKLWQDESARSIRATDLPPFTTDVEGYAPGSASGAHVGSSGPTTPTIRLTFRRDPPSDRPELDPQVSMATFARPAAYAPPGDCPTTSYVPSLPLPSTPCEAVGTETWWVPSQHAAIREEGDVLVVIAGDPLHPQSREVLVAAAEHVRPTDVDTLVAGVR